MKKSRAQLDREIAKALARAPHRRALGLSHSTQLANWWKKATPEEDHVCYATKTKALKAFLDTNHEVVQNYGGVDYAVSPSEFDAINHKYNLHGRKAARTIAQAVWAAMPEGKPYCLDRIDLDALNDTSPARESHLAFRLPDYVYEAAIAADEERHYRSLDDAHARKRLCRRCGRRLRQQLDSWNGDRRGYSTAVERVGIGIPLHTVRSREMFCAMHHRVLIEFVVDVPNADVARDVQTRIGQEHQARLIETLASVTGFVPLQEPGRPGIGVAYEPVTWSASERDWIGEDDGDDD